jgi:hypothetical protein
MSFIARTINEMKVYYCHGLTKVRLGGKHDGGYVVYEEACNLATGLFSFGIGDDMSFELEFDERFPNKNIELSDPYIDEPPVKGRFRFHKKGIGPGYDFCGINSNGILKMDVEGAEWDALASLAWYELGLFSQVIVEFHMLHVMRTQGLSPYFGAMYDDFYADLNELVFEKYFNVWSLMNEVFYCYHLHANNSLPMVELGGLAFPPLVEASFIRKDLVTSAEPFVGTLPIDGLDRPNKTDRPDIFWKLPLITGDSDVEREVKETQARYHCFV